MHDSERKVGPEDRAWFLAEVRQWFPATDEVQRELISRSLSRLEAFRATALRAAMEDYRTRWGGKTGRFYIGSFLEQLGEKNQLTTTRTAALRAIAEREEKVLRDATEMRAILAEREQMREAIADQPAAAVDTALAYLDQLGWGRPPQHIDRWSPTWLIAVHDLITGHEWPDLASPDKRTSARDALARVPRPSDLEKIAK